MSASLFLDTLRQHDLEQFYTTFSNHGINHLNGLAQLSLQDCAALGITDAVDRRKVFNLIQSLRNPNRLRIMTSASTLTSGLRQPQKYPRSAYEPSRLPQPQSAAPALDHTRARRQSIVSHPNQQQRPVRTRTMSDAGRLPDTSRKLDLPRSLLSNSSKNNDDDDDDEDEDDKPKSYRQSAPLLNAYGIPSSQQQKMRGRASMGALRPPGIRTQNLDSLPPSDLDQRIRVCVRKRPLSKKEIERGEKDIGKAIGTRSIQINEPKLRLDLTKYIEQHTFTFDDVFDADTSNDVIYERTALPLVKYIFQGGKATCFAYGQTGSGKTYTMLDPQHGLYIKATRDIFSLLGRPENQHLMAWVGLYEIYQGHLYDLLNGRKKLFAREDGRHNVVIAGLKEYAITKASDMVQVFEYGNQVRTTGSTGANDTSSRSHAVLQILLKPKKNRKVIHGKLSFIDLAGSERGADRGESDAKTRLEGAEINKSLLALKECIRALDLDKGHTPFRQSKLTQVLKDSFVGNSRTCMIATISPGASNSEHTLNTLRYADRVKELRGDKERRATAATTAAAAAATGPPPSIERRIEQPKREESWQSPASSPAAVTSISAEFSDEEYDSYTDESDILNDDDDEEEDIFDVDFPHEQDAFINSTTPASPPPRRRSSTPYYPSKPIDYTSDQSLENSPVSSPEPLHQLDASQMEAFVNLHRAQIREVTEYTKREAKLVGKISLSDNDPEEFERYLQELQEILEEKAAAVEVLRDRIHDTVNQLLKN